MKHDAKSSAKPLKNENKSEFWNSLYLIGVVKLHNLHAVYGPFNNTRIGFDNRFYILGIPYKQKAKTLWWAFRVSEDNEHKAKRAG